MFFEDEDENTKRGRRDRKTNFEQVRMADPAEFPPRSACPHLSHDTGTLVVGWLAKSSQVLPLRDSARLGLVNSSAIAKLNNTE